MDLFTQGNANIHAMVKLGQKPGEAIQEANKIINNPENVLILRAHTAADMESSLHKGQPWNSDVSVSDKYKHIMSETFHSDEQEVANAINATAAVISGNSSVGNTSKGCN